MAGRLEQMLDIEEWEMLQRSVAKVTGMAIVTVNYKGIPITEHSCCNRFCQKVRQNETLSSYCQKCDARGGVEAARNNSPYIYQCYFSIMDIAIPLIVNQQYVGAVMAGQVRLPVGEDESNIEKIFTPCSSQKLESVKKKFAAEYEEIPILSMDKIQTISMMLFYMCNYTIRETMHKEQTIHMYETFFSKQIPFYQNGFGNSYEKEKMEETIEESMDEKTEVEDNFPKTNNRILLQAFEYIHGHKHSIPSMAELAELCHVSPSYFSRLFTKDVGESYSHFISRLRVEWAKGLLESTDCSVQEISDKLGFSDSGYFIKTFKKHVGVTPAFYRTYCETQQI
jgi:ligand-binding sensor protein/AraC-like DNA-binding protein